MHLLSNRKNSRDYCHLLTLFVIRASGIYINLIPGPWDVSRLAESFSHFWGKLRFNQDDVVPGLQRGNNVAILFDVEELTPPPARIFGASQ